MCGNLVWRRKRKGKISEKRTNFVVIVDLHVGAVSVFGKKSDVVCGFFFGVFLCGFAVFELPYAPSSDILTP